MSRNVIMAAGALICAYGLLAFRGIFNIPVFLGALILFAGWKFATKMSSTGQGMSKPAVPAEFSADFWNKNIALDTNTRRLWLRDKDGSTAVMQASQIVRCEASSSSAQHQTNIGPRTVHLDTVLRVNVKDLGKPLWTIAFNAHPTRTMPGSQANYQELQDWQARVEALVTAQ